MSGNREVSTRFSVQSPVGLLVDDPILGRKIRGGAWEDQGIATCFKISEAIDGNRWHEAGELANYFIVEAEVCYRLYQQWIGDLRSFLLRQGMSEGELNAAEAQISAILILPDGSAWESLRSWESFLGDNATFLNAAMREDRSNALDLLDRFIETWRRCHDRHVDFISGLMDQVVQRHGESAIGPMYDHILLPWFNERYGQFDVDKHSWAEGLTLNMLVAFEAMRGHLCGPGRRGDVEFEELDDRYVLRFDPCGSGGRSVRGDEIEKTPPRMEAPYSWPVTKQPEAWNHFEPGVCVYCAHCIVLTEILPIDAFGYPVRAVDPPRYGVAGDDGQPAKCSWTMFKDPAEVPEVYFTRIGRKKPVNIGSGSRNHSPLPSNAPDAEKQSG